MRETRLNIRGLAILALVDNGYTYAEIGRMFGITRQAVYQFCKRVDMRSRNGSAGRPHTHAREPLSDYNRCMADHGRRYTAPNAD